MRIFRGSGWSDMQTRLIASFAIVSLLLVGLAVYQFERISQVRSSMTEQKREMDKRLSTAKISQFLQELDRLEGELKRENDAERIEPFRTVHQAMETELSRLDFSGSTAAQEDLEALRTKSGHYAGEVEKMAALLLDENADPLELLEQMDLLHTRTAAENVTMLDISSRLSAAADRNAGAAQALSFERLQDTLTMSALPRWRSSRLPWSSRSCSSARSARASDSWSGPSEGSPRAICGSGSAPRGRTSSAG